MRSLLALALLLAMGAAQAEEVLVGLMVNGKPVRDTMVVQRNADGDVLLPVEEWQALKGYDLDLAGKTGLVSARSLGIEPTFNAGEQSIDLQIPLTLRTVQRLRSRTPRVTEVAKQPLGVFANYDLAVRHDKRGTRTSLGLETRTGIGPGTLVATGQVNAAEGQVDVVRGLSTWNLDLLDKGVGVQLGDVFTPRTTLGAQVNLGGVRVSSERALRRDLNYQPVPMLGGVVQAASTTDLFLNGDKRGQYTLDQGRWELDQYPVKPGTNEVRAVVRDDFGREQVIEERFYYSPDALPKGMSEWDVSAGLVRQQGDTYAKPAAVANYRRGLSNSLTGNAQLQLSGNGRQLQLGAQTVLGTMGTLAVDAAGSQGPNGTGHALSVAYDFRNDDWSVHAGHTRYSQDYWTLAQERRDGSIYSASALQSTTTLAASYRPRGGNWSASLAAVDATYRDGRRQRRVDGALRWRGQQDDFGVGLSWAPEGNQVFASWQHRFGRTQLSTTVRAAPEIQATTTVSGKVGTASYVAGLAHDRQGTLAGGQVVLPTAKGQLSVGAQIREGERVIDGRFRGSLWAGEGGVFMQPENRGSFLLVQVPGQKGVPVQGSGGGARTTNRFGYALLPNVQPLHPSVVRMDASALPLEVAIESTRQPVTVGRRAGGKAVFAVQSEQVVELRIEQGGQPITGPVHASTDNEQILVGQGGVAFLMQAKPGQVLTVHLGEKGQCKAALPSELVADRANVIECR